MTSLFYYVMSLLEFLLRILLPALLISYCKHEKWSDTTVLTFCHNVRNDRSLYEICSIVNVILRFIQSERRKPAVFYIDQDTVPSTESREFPWMDTFAIGITEHQQDNWFCTRKFIKHLVIWLYYVSHFHELLEVADK